MCAPSPPPAPDYAGAAAAQGAANKDAKLDLQPLIEAIAELEARFDRAIKVKVIAE
jgi:hypothetical protein